MSQASQKHLTLRYSQGAAVIGFLDTYLQTEEAIQEVSQELLDLVSDRGLTKVLLTFEGVRFMSSSMFGAIVKLHRQLAKEKGRLRLCSLAPQLREILRASSLDKLLETFDDEASALAKF